MNSDSRQKRTAPIPIVAAVVGGVFVVVGACISRPKTPENNIAEFNFAASNYNSMEGKWLPIEIEIGRDDQIRVTANGEINVWPGGVERGDADGRTGPEGSLRTKPRSELPKIKTDGYENIGADKLGWGRLVGFVGKTWPNLTNNDWKKFIPLDDDEIFDSPNEGKLFVSVFYEGPIQNLVGNYEGEVKILKKYSGRDYFWIAGFGLMGLSVLLFLGILFRRNNYEQEANKSAMDKPDPATS